MERLGHKDGAEEVEVVIGDFATARLGRRFALVYLVFKGIENLTSQEEQVACFENAAAHLEGGGHFVIEVEVPQLQRLPPGEAVRPFSVTPRHLGFDEIDVVTQGLVSHHYFLDDRRLRTLSVPFRYVWPSELDLVARLARMKAVGRYAGFDRSRFDSTSISHVSVFRALDR